MKKTARRRAVGGDTLTLGITDGMVAWRGPGHPTRSRDRYFAASLVEEQSPQKRYLSLVVLILDKVYGDTEVLYASVLSSLKNWFDTISVAYQFFI